MPEKGCTEVRRGWQKAKPKPFSTMKTVVVPLLPSRSFRFFLSLLLFVFLPLSLPPSFLPSTTQHSHSSTIFLHLSLERNKYTYVSIYMYTHVHFRSEPLLCPCCAALWLDQGGGGGEGARSRLPLCLGPFHFSVVYSAARFSPPLGDRASLTFAFRETCSPPDSFSRLIGSFQPIYGASQGDRVISFGFENGHHLYRAVANFCQPDGNDDSDRTPPSTIFRKMLTRREFPNTCQYLRNDTIFIQKKEKTVKSSVTDKTPIRV